MNLQACVDELLQRGVEDWVHNVGVAWIAKSTGGATTPDEVRTVSLAMVEEVLAKRYMDIGELSGPGHSFLSWGLPVPEALQRADTEWRKPGQADLMGQVFWLRNTQEGDRRGAAVPPRRVEP